MVNEEDMFLWEVALFGPPDTLYQGGYFKAHLKFPPDYPYNPPSIRFLSKVWHPNIIRKQVAASHAEADRDQVVVPLTMEEYCIKAKSRPMASDNIDMTDFYDDDYDIDDDEDEEEDDDEDNEGEDSEDSGTGKA